MSRAVRLAPLLLLGVVAGSGPAQPAPDRLEELLWQGAANADSVSGYDTYLRRYPGGSHADAARAALGKLGVAPVGAGPAPVAQTAPPLPSEPAISAPAAVPPPAPAPAPAPPAQVASAPASPPVVAENPEGGNPSPLFMCRPQIAAGAAPLERASEAELSTYLRALHVSSVEAYQRYLDAYPKGVFAPAVSDLVKGRSSRARALAATQVAGPVAARLRHPLTATPEDYPPEAGKLTSPAAATAVWEIAEDGCVQSCRIDKSSGSPALDEATCRIATAKSRYDPARDAGGKPIRAVGTGTVNWAVVR